VKIMNKRNLIIGGIIVVLGIAFLTAGCSGQQVVPFEPTSQLDYHDGYWVAKMDIPDQLVSLTVINDMHIDAETNSVTVYAQSKALGRIVAPAQVGPGECTEDGSSGTVCFHPDAVYLNGSGEELMEADGTGEWWVKHAWILGGEGYDNCELRPQESYDDCIWAEGELLNDGLTMKVGGIFDAETGAWAGNHRTPVFHEDGEVTYRVTRFSPVNLDPNAGEIDLTLKSDWVLEWTCEEEPSAFDNRTRECPKVLE